MPTSSDTACTNTKRENNVGVGLIYPTEEGMKHIELADEAHAHKAPIVARDWFLLAVSAGDLRKRQRRDKSEENGPACAWHLSESTAPVLFLSSCVLSSCDPSDVTLNQTAVARPAPGTFQDIMA